VIVIGSTRKPTQRVRSFIRELDWAIPQTTRLTRGKQSLADFCEDAHDIGASRILLVGSFHGNPGRLGFLHYVEDSWMFRAPTILLKFVRLLRETQNNLKSRCRTLFIVPDTENDTIQAKILAEALGMPLVNRTDLPQKGVGTSILLVALRRRSCIEFHSLHEEHLMGPTLFIKRFLSKAMGDMKQW
jgi:rRNA maturation protein Rpf1